MIRTAHNGFTLMEIIIVIIVLVGLATIAIPKYLTIIEKFHASEGEQTLLTLFAAQKRYLLEHNTYAMDVRWLDVATRPLTYFEDPTFLYGPNTLYIERKNSSYALRIDMSCIGDKCITCSCVICSGESVCGKLGY